MWKISPEQCFISFLNHFTYDFVHFGLLPEHPNVNSITDTNKGTFSSYTRDSNRISVFWFLFSGLLARSLSLSCARALLELPNDCKFWSKWDMKRLFNNTWHLSNADIRMESVCKKLIDLLIHWFCFCFCCFRSHRNAILACAWWNKREFLSI